MLANHLDRRIGTEELEHSPNRQGYGEGLLAAGQADERVVAVCADLTESTRTNLFAEAFPERFIQVGVAEQNMASVASGLSAMGMIPFMASYAMFSPGRNWEQIRTTICYNEANVKIVGAHAGISVGPDGATHQAIEDIALTRVLPGLTVIAPGDTIEARKAARAAAKHNGPVYLRIAREKTPVVTTEDSPFTIGKAELFFTRQSEHEKTVGLIVTGTLVHEALISALELNKEGIGVSVLHLPTIKPLDADALLGFADRHELIVTLEEHQVCGGLGGAISEFYSEYKPKRVIKIGVEDQFGQSGNPIELMAHYGLDAKSVIARIKQSVA